METNELKERCPILYWMKVEMDVCHGGANTDWIHPTKNWKIPKQWLEPCLEAEKLAKEYKATTFGDIWKDMPEQYDLGPDTKIMEYATFPEESGWNAFLEKFPKFKVLDDVLYQLFDAEMHDATYFEVTDDITPEQEQEAILKAAGLWTDEMEKEKDDKRKHNSQG